MPFLLSYTRKEIDSVFYDARLAFSLHLAVSKDGKNFVALNHNSGVLFAKASENDDGSLNPKTLGFPIIVSKNDLQELGIVSFDDAKSVFYNEIDKSYAVAAILLGPDGQDFQEKNNEKDAVLFFTDDFVHYSESQKIRFEDYEKIKKNAFLQMQKLDIKQKTAPSLDTKLILE